MPTAEASPVVRTAETSAVVEGVRLVPYRAGRPPLQPAQTHTQQTAERSPFTGGLTSRPCAASHGCSGFEGLDRLNDLEGLGGAYMSMYMCM